MTTITTSLSESYFVVNMRDSLIGLQLITQAPERRAVLRIFEFSQQLGTFCVKAYIR